MEIQTTGAKDITSSSSSCLTSYFRADLLEDKDEADVHVYTIVRNISALICLTIVLIIEIRLKNIFFLKIISTEKKTKIGKILDLVLFKLFF